jgi:hypothetical protein
MMAGHGREAGIDLPLLAAPDLVDRRAHVVVDSAPGNAARNPEGVIVSISRRNAGSRRDVSRHW